MNQPEAGPRAGRARPALSRLVLYLAIAALVGYGAASLIVYDKLTAIPDACSGSRADPTSFAIDGIDTAPFHLPPAMDVRFPARDDPAITIAGSWFPVDAGRAAPTVVLVHGLGGCRHSARDLLAAGMLHRNGIAVLMIDLRDHGDSSREDGRFAGGTDEYRDVLGAFDWLLEQGVPDARIGLLGFSLGAATSMIAMGQEPRIAATWSDSSYGDIGTAIRDELSRNGYPTILEPGGIVAARILGGDDLAGHSPLETTSLLDGRPLFVTHGQLDTRISVRAAHVLVASAAAHGQDAELWIVPDAEHTQALTLHPEAYEERLSAFFRRALGG